MKILVVDDRATNRMVISIPLKDMGYDCVEAENGEQALEQYLAESPDLILMDVVMPVMDGYEATERIKQLAGTKHIPIIFLTAKSDEKGLAKCIECGGDDFLQKPVNATLLKSKIDAHMRIKSLMLELQQKNNEIGSLHETLQQEHETGRHVLSHALSRNWNDCPNLKSHLASQSIFNGDIMLTAPKPLGGLYLLLGDITGHGLAAAMGTVPLSQAFFAMTAKGKPVSSIVREMNRSLYEFLPRSMFCAALMLEMDSDGRHVRIWSGGIPLAFVIPREGPLQEIASKHLPLGVLEPSAFDNTSTDYELAEGDSVLLMTDGIPESTAVDGSMFGEKRIRSAIEQSKQSAFDEILHQHQSFVKGSQQSDDVTLIELEAGPIPHFEGRQVYSAKLPWKASIVLEDSRLISIPDPILEVVSLLPERLELAVYQDRISTVLAELYSNALEHGILGLSSDLKHSAEGFSEYYRLREEKLSALEKGRIEIGLEYDPVSDSKELILRIFDSGQGFDWSAGREDTSERSFGRGLSVVASMCRSLEFNDAGNEVTARIKLE